MQKNANLVLVRNHAIVFDAAPFLFPHCQVRGLLPLEATPGLISLLAGKPNASTFPFTELSFKARSPTDPNQELSLNVDGADLALGLQYTDTAGIQKLREWLYGLQEKMHGRKRGEGWQLSVGSGSQDLIFKVMLESLPCNMTYLITTH